MRVGGGIPRLQSNRNLGAVLRAAKNRTRFGNLAASRGILAAGWHVPTRVPNMPPFSTLSVADACKLSFHS